MASSTVAPAPTLSVPANTKKRKQQTIDYVPDPYTFRGALRDGDIFTRLSVIVWGLGNLVRKQFVKGFLWLVIEALFVYYFIATGFHQIAGLFKLDTGGQQVCHEETSGFGTSQVCVSGPQSVSMLLYGLASILLILVFIFGCWFFTRSAYRAQSLQATRGRAPGIRSDLHDLIDAKIQNFLMALPTLGILIFTVTPLIFMISMAFTSYDSSHVATFGWVGLQNFGKVFGTGTSAGVSVNAQQFFSVLIWTLVWAFLATFLNYFLGMGVAMLINRNGTRFKGMWRTFFALSMAVPQFVSLLVVSSMLSMTGILNTLLKDWGWISSSLPFWTNPWWARVAVIVINLWIGIPYTIMQVTGVLQNIPPEQYESDRMYGASAWQIFRAITLPYMFFVMTPYLIATFVGNVNNFNVIYFLTGGGPTNVGNTAGSTDLLVTWLYKLTVTQHNYNVGAVIGIMTFVILAVVSLVTYRSSGSYKDEGGFR